MRYEMFYKCTNVNCYWKAAYNKVKAKECNYRCLACMSRLNECELLYVESRFGVFFNRYRFCILAIVSLIYSAAYCYLLPPSYGGVIDNRIVAYVVTSLLMFMLIISVNSRILNSLEATEKVVEDNLRPLNAALMSCGLMLFFAMLKICL